MDHVIGRQQIGWGRFKVQFENKITTGAILQILCMAAAFCVFLLNYEHRMTLLEAATAQASVHMVEQDQELRLIQQQLQGRVIPAGTPP